MAHPHLFRRVAVRGICVGEVPLGGETRKKEPKTGSQHVELDPHAPLESLYADKLDQAVIYINFFHVDAADHDDFKLAWGEEGDFLTRQPGCLSTQMHWAA